MLRSWIEQGAVYEKHWAFEPPSAEAPPVVDSSVSNPIDSFIVEKLKASGLRLSAPAVPEVQLRRLYLDTIGIPPTPEQIDQFLVHCQVDADGAYRQAVDRLLASPGMASDGGDGGWTRHATPTAMVIPSMHHVRYGRIATG